MGASFERFLDKSKDYSVQLQFRENGEVMAGIYILRNDMHSGGAISLLNFVIIVFYLSIFFSLNAPSLLYSVMAIIFRANHPKINF